MITFGNATQRSGNWTWFLALVGSKNLRMQYDEDTIVYLIYCYDGVEVLTCVIWKGDVPSSVAAGGYSQAQNDADRTAFETSYKPWANVGPPGSLYAQNALRQIHVFGNVTTAAVTEVLVSARSYVEQGAQAQRSVKSTSVQDAAAGSGSKAVRIVYLDSNYVQKTEDIALNGTTAVDTVATDIRFIQDFFVIQGAAAVGALSLMTTTAGGGSEFCGIGVGTTQAFLCHHYVPVGKKAYILNWGANCNDEANFKLTGQAIYGANRVDDIIDLFNLTAGNPTPPTNLRFDRAFPAPIVVGEKCYIRATVVPVQATATIIRAYFDLWEE